MDIVLALKTSLKVFFIIFFGLTGARYLEKKGLAERLEKKFSKNLKALGIPDYMIFPFITAFFAGFAGEALVALAFEQKKIKENELIPCMMLIDFPLYFSFVPLLLGITVPLAGKVGLYYIGLQLTVSLIMTCTGVLIFYLRKKSSNRIKDAISHIPYPEKTEEKNIVKDSLRVSVKITVIVFTALVLVSILYKMGLINLITKAINHIHVPFFKPEMAPITAAHALHIAAAAAVAGKMVSKGLDPFTATLGMMWGNFVGTPIRGMRLVIPRYAGMFGTKRAVKLWCINQVYRALLVLSFIVLLSIIKGF